MKIFYWNDLLIMQDGHTFSNASVLVVAKDFERAIEILYKGGNHPNPWKLDKNSYPALRLDVEIVCSYMVPDYCPEFIDVHHACGHDCY